jgi:signal peptidase I
MAKPQNRDTKPARSPEPAPVVTARPLGSFAKTLRWFTSGTVRHASALRKHVQKLLNHQRDVLAPQARDAIEGALRDLRSALDSDTGKAALEEQMENLETVANKWLKPYPNAAWRENVEVLLVALTVAMGIRTFFLQPFKIPTGSMQPTLYGVTSENLKNDPNFKFPTGLEAVRQWFEGVSYIHKVAESDGQLTAVDAPVRLLIFNIFQSFVVGGKTYTIWFPPDSGSGTLFDRGGVRLGQFFNKGEDILKLKVVAGDHLFVDRVSYNFRPPERGEIIVFETKGIPEDRRIGPGWNIPPDQFYIKRLVALGDERVRIGEDRHLIINGKRLDAATPHFEKVYSFNPKGPPQESHYSGHVDGHMPYLEGHPDGIVVPKGEVMVMGDNTMNSLDSRYWGSFPQSYVIGKSFFVYWPITDRFGWGYHR